MTRPPLALVKPGQLPRSVAPVPAGQPVPFSRVRLSLWQRMEVEEARKLVMEAPDVAPELLGSPRMAYLAGRLEGAAANLLDILDVITELGGGS